MVMALGRCPFGMCCLAHGVLTGTGSGRAGPFLADADANAVVTAGAMSRSKMPNGIIMHVSLLLLAQDDVNKAGKLRGKCVGLW